MDVKPGFHASWGEISDKLFKIHALL